MLLMVSWITKVWGKEAYIQITVFPVIDILLGEQGLTLKSQGGREKQGKEGMKGVRKRKWFRHRKERTTKDREKSGSKELGEIPI